VIQSLPEGLGGFVAVFFHDGLNLFRLQPSVVEKLQVYWIGGARPEHAVDMGIVEVSSMRNV
jgi:hypothetical protein